MAVLLIFSAFGPLFTLVGSLPVRLAFFLVSSVTKRQLIKLAFIVSFPIILLLLPPRRLLLTLPLLQKDRLANTLLGLPSLLILAIVCCHCCVRIHSRRKQLSNLAYIGGSLFFSSTFIFGYCLPKCRPAASSSDASIETPDCVFEL